MNESLAREILELLMTPENIYDEDIVKVAAKIAQIREADEEGRKEHADTEARCQDTARRPAQSG